MSKKNEKNNKKIYGINQKTNNHQFFLYLSRQITIKT